MTITIPKPLIAVVLAVLAVLFVKEEVPALIRYIKFETM